MESKSKNAPVRCVFTYLCVYFTKVEPIFKANTNLTRRICGISKHTPTHWTYRLVPLGDQKTKHFLSIFYGFPHTPTAGKEERRKCVCFSGSLRHYKTVLLYAKRTSSLFFVICEVSLAYSTKCGIICMKFIYIIFVGPSYKLPKFRLFVAKTTRSSTFVLYGQRCTLISYTDKGEDNVKS